MTDATWNGEKHIKVSNTDLKVTQEDWDRIFKGRTVSGDDAPLMRGFRDYQRKDQSMRSNTQEENPVLDDHRQENRGLNGDGIVMLLIILGVIAAVIHHWI